MAEMELLRETRGRDQLQYIRNAIPWVTPQSIRDIPSTMAITRRAVSCRDAYLKLPRSAGVSTRQRVAADNAVTATSPIPALPASESLRALYYGGQHMSPLNLGQLPHTTPMSICGPSCGGSLLTVTTLNWRSTSAVIRTRLGRKAFAYTPYTGNSVTQVSLPWQGAVEYTDGTLQQRLYKYSTNAPCPHCDPNGTRGTMDSPWHLMLECQHADLVQLRLRLTASAPLLLNRLLRSIQDGHSRAGRITSTNETTLQMQQLQTLCDRATWIDADGKHVLFHLITALPWPASVATQCTPLSAWLGKLFDDTILERRFRRRPADIVIRWASHWIKAFANERWRLLTLSHAVNAVVV